MNTDSILKNLTLDEKIGQLPCFSIGGMSNEEMESCAQKTKAGSFFVSAATKDKITNARKIFAHHSKLPIIVAADVEAGPGMACSEKSGEVYLPREMAWGACDDPELIEKAHIATAERCRELGIH